MQIYTHRYIDVYLYYESDSIIKLGKAWCPAHAAKNEWLLVDLGVASKISGVVTQGRGNVKEWITHFMVSYSLDAYKWEFARDIYGNKKVHICSAFVLFLFKHC